MHLLNNSTMTLFAANLCNLWKSVDLLPDKPKPGGSLRQRFEDFRIHRYI
jgi:hypothetical protein